jgi:hypothetical protein
MDQQAAHTPGGSTNVSDTQGHRRHLAPAMTTRTLTGKSPIKFAMQRTAVSMDQIDSRSVWVCVTAFMDYADPPEKKVSKNEVSKI